MTHGYQLINVNATIPALLLYLIISINSVDLEGRLGNTDTDARSGHGIGSSALGRAVTLTPVIVV